MRYDKPSNQYYGNDYTTCKKCFSTMHSAVALSGLCEPCQAEQGIGRFIKGLDKIATIADNLERVIKSFEEDNLLFLSRFANKPIEATCDSAHGYISRSVKIPVFEGILRALDDMTVSVGDKIIWLDSQRLLLKDPVKIDSPFGSAVFEAQTEAIEESRRKFRRVITILKEIQEA